jgi:RHS repeat-associated protein
MKMGYRGDGMRVWKMGQWVQVPPGGREGGGLDAEPIIGGRWVYKYDGQMMVQETYQANAQSAIQHTQFVPGMRGVECRMKPDLSVDWFVYDAHGNVVATVDGQGATWGEVRNVRKFDVWGSQRGDTVEPSTPPDHAYCGNLGHTQDDELGGLIYMRARYYEPWTARFISEDPAGHGGNWYIYASNNPVGRSDPDGAMDVASFIRMVVGLIMIFTGLAMMGAEVQNLLAVMKQLNIVSKHALQAKAGSSLIPNYSLEIMEADEAALRRELRRAQVRVGVSAVVGALTGLLGYLELLDGYMRLMDVAVDYDISWTGF